LDTVLSEKARNLKHVMSKDERMRPNKCFFCAFKARNADVYETSNVCLIFLENPEK
jgi:hypothetical protein